MLNGVKRVLLALVLAIPTACASGPARADDPIEKAGIGVGVTAGNLIAIPAKAISVTMGAIFGAASFVLTGGNADLTKQIWQDTTQPPYLITPDVAQKAVGQRPELKRQDIPATPTNERDTPPVPANELQ
jgi:hypothetical protein